MSNKVKHYICGLHTGLTTGWNTNDAESIIGLLRSIFVNGFNSTTVSTLSRSGSTVTVYVSTGHGLADKQVILISGATPSDYNGEWTVSYVDANNVTFQIAGTPTTPATGTITCKAAPLGWDELYTGNSNKMVLRSPNTAGTRMYYRFEEPATQTTTRSTTGTVNSLAGMKVVKVGMYSGMTDLDTGVLECYGFMHKNPAASTQTGRNLIVVGDDTTAYIFLAYDTANPLHTLHAIGDYVPVNPDDNWCAFLCAKYGFAATTDFVYSNVFSSTLHDFTTTSNAKGSVLLPRPTNGQKPQFDIPAHFVGTKSSTIDPGAAGISLAPVHQFGGVRRAFPVYLMQNALTYQYPNLVRGRVPGLYNTGTQTLLARGWEFVSPALIGAVSGATLLSVRTYNVDGTEYGAWAIDITGPWR